MRDFAAAVGLGLVLAAVFFAPYLWRGEHFLPMSCRAAPPWFDPAATLRSAQDGAGTDKLIFNYPNWIHAANSLRNDPSALLWNSGQFGGTPFLATQNTAVLYPFTWLALLPDPVLGLLIHAALHVWLATILAYAAARRFGATGWGAAVGAVSFGGGTWISAHHDTLQFVQAGIWIPLILWGILAIVHAPRRSFVAISLGTALSWLGGMPQITILGLILAGVVCLARLTMVSGWRDRLRVLGRASLSVFIGVLLATPQLASTFEYAQTSSRLEQNIDTLAQEGLRVPELASLVLPSALGIEGEVDRFRKESELAGAKRLTVSSLWPIQRFGLTGADRNSIERAGSPGLVALLLAILALGARPDRRLVFCVILFGIAIAMALGSDLFRWAAHLPGFRFGSPKRWIFVASLALSGIAVLGVERWRTPRASWPWILWVVAAVLGVAWLVAPGGPLGGGANADEPARLFLAYLRPDIGWMAVVLALLGLSSRLHPRLRLPALVLLMMADLARWHFQLNPGQVDAPALSATPSVALLQEKVGPGDPRFRFVRFKNLTTDLPEVATAPVALPPNLGMLYGLRDVQGYEAIVSRRVEELADTIEPGLLVAHHLWRELRDPQALQHPVLDLLGVRYVLSSGLLPLPLVAPFPGERVAVYERPSALPRVTLVLEVHVLESEADVLARLADPAHDPSRVALVSRSDPQAGAMRPTATSASLPADAQAELVSERGTELKIRFRAPPGTLLRLADTYHPGWTAEISGQSLPILVVDHALRGVVLPIPEGVLTFTYAPVAWTLGLWGGSLGLAGWLFVLRCLGGRPIRDRHSLPTPHA